MPVVINIEAVDLLISPSKCWNRAEVFTVMKIQAEFFWVVLR
jgi:hypothetical protein